MIILFLGNEKVVINVSLDKNETTIPVLWYEDSAGYDLPSAETITVPKWSRKLVNTKLRFDIPKGFYGEIKPRSGLSIKKGVVAFNSTIDSGYSGFAYIIVFNFSNDDYLIEKGDRIAQIIFRKCHSVIFNIVDKSAMTVSIRGKSGFGSSGV